uniref:Rpn family recombination-promoting nuclease/putative transposase n=1 Tax=Agathobacter sp. TaxID=2021311 RepID=UPI0040560D57
MQTENVYEKASIGSYKNASGKADYGMTNDYMFRAVLQKNQKALKGLICAVLHLSFDEVESVVIMNPIQPGDSIDEKTFILDINVLLNNNTVINLEMQMADQLNWKERSLSYLCCSFDGLYKGEEYTFAKPAIHIGFLNFSPFPNNPEFYATYKLMNVKNHIVYSDKFVLSVIDLKHINLATKEDKAFQIDYWAKLFTATSWEDLKMIAENNTYLSEAAQTIYELNADEITRRQCQARADYQRCEKYKNELIHNLTEENVVLTGEITQLMDKNTQLIDERTQLMDKNTQLIDERTQLMDKNAQLTDEIMLLRKHIAQLEANKP